MYVTLLTQQPVQQATEDETLSPPVQTSIYLCNPSPLPPHTPTSPLRNLTRCYLHNAHGLPRAVLGLASKCPVPLLGSYGLVSVCSCYHVCQCTT